MFLFTPPPLMKLQIRSYVNVLSTIKIVLDLYNDKVTDKG